MIKTTTSSASHSPNQTKPPAQPMTRATNTHTEVIDKMLTQCMQLFSHDPVPVVTSPTQLALAISYATLLYECAMKKQLSSELPPIKSEKIAAKTTGLQSTSVSLLFSPCKKQPAEHQHHDYAQYALSNLVGIKLPKR